MTRRSLFSDLLCGLLDLGLILAALIFLSSCAGGSPTAPSPTPAVPVKPAPVCRQVLHPETKRTEAILVGGRLQFIVIITPAWEETVCQ